MISTTNLKELIMLYRKFSNPNKITLKELVDKNILNEEELTATVENMELEGSLSLQTSERPNYFRRW